MEIKIKVYHWHWIHSNTENWWNWFTNHFDKTLEITLKGWRLNWGNRDYCPAAEGKPIISKSACLEGDGRWAMYCVWNSQAEESCFICIPIPWHSFNDINCTCSIYFWFNHQNNTKRKRLKGIPLGNENGGGVLIGNHFSFKSLKKFFLCIYAILL